MLSSILRNCVSKPFPNFIRDSNIVSADTEINKIFPRIGLPNSKERVDVKFDFAEVQLDKVIHLAIRRYLSEFEQHHCIEDFKGIELFKMANILYVFTELSRRFNKKVGVAYTNGVVRLTTPIPSYDGKALVRTGTNCFKLTKTLLAAGRKYCSVDLVSSDEIADQCKNLQIAFSSSDLEGAWDIATMSMRGIKSCMRWEARQAQALTGSITDPCCGIIYLTNGTKTQYGSKMLFRAVVRLIVNSLTNEPALLVDRLYSSFYKTKPEECSKLDEQVKALFVKYLKNKVPNIDVYESARDKHALAHFVIPKPANYSLLEEQQRSYRDTAIDYSPTYLHTMEDKIYKKLGIKKDGTSKKQKATKYKTKAVSF